MTDRFKVWPCRKRWPKMRPVINTTRVDHVSWLRTTASVGVIVDDAADFFDQKVERAARANKGEKPDE